MGNRVRRLDIKSGALSLVAGTGSASYSGDSGNATSADISNPHGLAFDKSGNLYIADWGNNRVRKVATSGIITTVAGTGDASTSGDSGKATSASIHEPAAVAVDDSGNLYIAEQLGNVVRKVTTAGIIRTVAGTRTAGVPLSQSGVATQQPLNQPQGVAWDPSGSLLIADTGNNFVRRLTSDGTITTIAGSRTTGGSDGGPATSAILKGPYSAAADTYGNIYIADGGEAKIRLVGKDGIISTVAGNGSAGYNGDGSPATAYSLNTPNAVLPASGCSVLIADTANNRIRQLWPAVNYTIITNPAGLQVTHSQRRQYASIW